MVRKRAARTMSLIAINFAADYMFAGPADHIPAMMSMMLAAGLAIRQPAPMKPALLKAALGLAMSTGLIAVLTPYARWRHCRTTTPASSYRRNSGGWVGSSG
jgi:hypothetical protein